ncbi:hypothetical protein Mnod_3449 [Methylobacterium nodulans ORS 2060]|uniref:Uncharacterized protein n=1 Tax=Methylobacterium nodulans (strain LMG 21967 / CNCM I-2342 / ORS 2060) TaxID=460265 RepID=B8IMH5_METNO|nr:hypothetical protein Mnod_3449 [Methylobacterium nodulans ORS 2060]
MRAGALPAEVDTGSAQGSASHQGLRAADRSGTALVFGADRAGLQRRWRRAQREAVDAALIHGRPFATTACTIHGKLVPSTGCDASPAGAALLHLHAEDRRGGRNLPFGARGAGRTGRAALTPLSLRPRGTGRPNASGLALLAPDTLRSFRPLRPCNPLRSPRPDHGLFRMGSCWKNLGRFACDALSSLGASLSAEADDGLTAFGVRFHGHQAICRMIDEPECEASVFLGG